MTSSRDQSHATIRPMPPRRRQAPDTPAVRALTAAAAAYQQAEEQLRKAIIEAAREAAQDDSTLTFAEIGRQAGYSREYVYRLAAEAGIKRPPTRKAE
jgi:flagellar biosynthesis/type III secretory pathway protein FliH